MMHELALVQRAKPKGSSDADKFRPIALELARKFSYSNRSSAPEHKSRHKLTAGSCDQLHAAGSLQYTHSVVNMTLFILTETSAGYALLKAKDKKLLKRDDLASETESAEGICSLYVASHATSLRHPLSISCAVCGNLLTM